MYIHDLNFGNHLKQFASLKFGGISHLEKSDLCASHDFSRLNKKPEGGIQTSSYEKWTLSNCNF